ncbi:hypothetical protein [Myxococcus llanfairpwllgwyngyllgogerychwyrndrobwllllantysiliogogogochensis]|uniref:hypothetical protein n=1 Tax=Myxococcus llanfairpwllgwyngyllgogerychwyrndrobwllllantysiliogogogochensis TaxID=2590453 RepID=UPI0015EFEC1D|nr:hypothetical protein [Myxococcus llanfairpwllgwyngyllgogerychwyrndrobwllllantysiliogogogochensis]
MRSGAPERHGVEPTPEHLTATTAPGPAHALHAGTSMGFRDGEGDAAAVVETHTWPKAREPRWRMRRAAEFGTETGRLPPSNF